MKPIRLHGAAVLLAVLSASAALAGACPPDQVLTEPRELEMPPDRGVDRPTIGAVQLKGWRGLGDMTLRMRRLTVAPDGIVPTHPHDDRPSIVTVLDGEIWEHSNHCAVPILHRAGDVTPEFGPGTAHWWENTSGRPVVLMATDVVPWLDVVKEEHSPDDPGM
jgi:quercetin dioxygenase-like cupin family protein